ncbi:hypothetical protein COR50_20780 [Chitinophaga caeni]|uniref:HTH araC/xylS-type domain-containing protein n=1 Tax=Chitinophaga caeni TaxID=2029983 RepID=A0A291QZQ9_9BACT|nr:AraC family transcriptional regulator [Chitinophaga caeni]ATL49415.1 hypothetical protein COR50_20780 [Chitinophaga caeni]
MEVLNTADIPVYSLKDCTAGSEFVIKHLKYTVDSEYSVEPPHRHDGFSIGLMLKGSSTLFLDFEKFVVNAPAVLLITPEQVHKHELITDSEFISLYFTSDFLLAESEGMISCWECVFNNNLIHLSPSHVQELLSYTDIMMREVKENKPRKSIIIRNILSAFITACGRISAEDAIDIKGNGKDWNNDTSQLNIFRQFKLLVDRNYKELAQVSDYADMLHVTPGHLNDMVKTVTGNNAKHIIDTKRVTEAKRLLYWRQHSVKEIAFQLNFDDDAYFNRYFKRHTGITPASFQRTIREKYN